MRKLCLISLVIVLVIALVAGLSLTSCEPTPTPEDYGSVMGEVTDTAGNPLGDVTISVAGESDVSNEQGQFSISNVAVGDRVLVKFSKSGYATAYKVTDVRIGEASWIEVPMGAVDVSQSIDAASGGNITTPDGGMLDIGADSLVDSQGNSFTGTAVVSLTVFDPSDEIEVNAFSGEYLGINAVGETEPIKSYGFMDISVTGSGELQLAPEKTATIRIPVPDDMQAEAESMGTCPLWYFDTETGYWREEGQGTYDSVSGCFEGTISHFSTWNYDVAFPRAYISGRVVDSSGPVQGARVDCWGPGWAYYRWASGETCTAADGTFNCIPVECTVVFSCQACKGTLNSPVYTFGPFSCDTGTLNNPNYCWPVGDLDLVLLPPVPTGLTCNAVYYSQIDLSWNPCSGATGYKIYRCTGTDCTPTNLVHTTPTTSWSNTGLVYNTTYRYRVTAYNEAGESDYSATVGCTTPTPTSEPKIYTTDADFDEGVLVGVEHETVHDQLQVSNTTEEMALPFIWVPNYEGTVSKVDTNTGDELGRYMVAPHSDCDPSRTTVDLQGNCWVGLRQAGTVVKIGLYEAGQWIDRNGDSICQTSQDLNDDGDITGSEILPWGQDECVLYEVVLIPGKEGTYEPNTYTGGYDYDYWGTAPRGLAVDANNNLWAGTWSSSKYYYIDGTTGAITRSVDVYPHNAYGAVIDQNGILWSAEGPGGDADSIILRLDTSTDSISFHDLGHTCYGLGLDYNDHLWVSSYWNDAMSRVDILANPPTFVTYNVPEQDESRGVAATSDNNMWVANTGADTVTRYDNNGNLLATITGLYGPTGVAVDANGKVWATDYDDEYIHRIDPDTNTVDLSKLLIDSLWHYTYSDMTGIVVRTITTKATWTVTYDSGTQDSPWGIVSWTSYEPPGTSVTIEVRSSNNQIDWSSWETASNGVALSATPNGQYLQIETTFQIIAENVSPILYDLTVFTT